jgi:hypothetical protein
MDMFGPKSPEIVDNCHAKHVKPVSSSDLSLAISICQNDVLHERSSLVFKFALCAYAQQSENGGGGGSMRAWASGWSSFEYDKTQK